MENVAIKIVWKGEAEMTYKTKNWKRKNNKDKKDTLYMNYMLQAALWQSHLQSTQNTKDMTIHTDISEIID